MRRRNSFLPKSPLRRISIHATLLLGTGVVLLSACTPTRTAAEWSGERCTDAPPPSQGSPSTDADKAIAQLRPNMKKCYQELLAEDRNAQGCVLANLRITPDNTRTCTISVRHGLDEPLGECLCGVVKELDLSPPATGTTLSIPVTFIQKH
jgi:hypothetical protein